MTTLSAIKPRPFTMLKQQAVVDLVLAQSEDLKELNGYDENGKAIFSLRFGMVYWLQSSITGNIEKTPRQITEDCDPNDIKDWLDHKMIWIAKYPFNK